MLYTTYYDSILGKISIASDGESLIGLWIENQKYFQATIHEPIIEKENLDIFIKTKEWLDRYFSNQKPNPKDLPLSPQGTPFQKMVWDVLCDISYGDIMTYGDIAKTIAKRLNKSSMSAQAIGGAVSHNPISIIIPCHRVVGTNGSLTGYAGGIDKKIKLLELEGVDLEPYFIPTKGSAL